MPVETLLLRANEWVPNNPRFPLLIYRKAGPTRDKEDTAAWFERRFVHNGWPPSWRNGVYDFHHYHSTAHEALGFAAGWARLTFGGPGGTEILVETGDAAVLPAGVGHRLLESSPDFLVVGAYPRGQDFDICRSAPSEEQKRAIASLGVPQQDPIEEHPGALLRHWE